MENKRVIYHIDVNSAFLSWEAVYRLKFLSAKVDLREEKAVIGGDMSLRHGIVLAKSIPCKTYGIKTGESVLEARAKCPELIVVPPNYGLYEKCSNAFIDMLREYSPDVEQYSIDEAFVDMTNVTHLYAGNQVEMAYVIKNRIREELGFTVNCGVSSNKLLAKMASDFKKPDMVHTLFPEEIERKMWPLPVEDLFFVGQATAKKLYNLGIRTIGQLAKSDLTMLRTHLKSHADIVWNFANGLDYSMVITTPARNKGYGNSTTIAHDVVDEDSAQTVFLALAETVGKRLRADEVKIKVVAVGIRYSDLSYCSHQKNLGIETNITIEIYKAACELFAELWNGQPIRHLGIHTNKVHEEDYMRQIELCFEENEVDFEKLMTMDATVDAIRSRYGNDSVLRARFIKSPIDHMSGGISREKRTVDYSKLVIE